MFSGESPKVDAAYTLVARDAAAAKLAAALVTACARFDAGPHVAYVPSGDLSADNEFVDAMLRANGFVVPPRH